MLKNIFIAVTLLIAHESIICMQNPGMQEIARKRAEFQTALKKVHDEQAAQEAEKGYDRYPTPTRASVLQVHRDEVAQNKKTAKELLALFDAATPIY